MRFQQQLDSKWAEAELDCETGAEGPKLTSCIGGRVGFVATILGLRVCCVVGGIGSPVKSGVSSTFEFEVVVAAEGMALCNGAFDVVLDASGTEVACIDTFEGASDDCNCGVIDGNAESKYKAPATFPPLSTTLPCFTLSLETACEW